MTKLPPLNGSKTHPLTEHAWLVLVRLQRDPLPTQEINPGVVNRLLREDFIEIQQRTSPYAVHQGAKIGTAVITKAGLELLLEGRP